MKDFKKLSLRKIFTDKSNEKIKPPYICPAFLILPEEKVIFKTHPHWLFVVVPEVALLALGILLIEYLQFFLIDQILPLRWVLVLLGEAWCFVMTIIFLDWICINYYLTNLRLIEERGIIGKRIMSIWLDKVQDVTCKFGILGRIFGFGGIEIESAGTYGKIVFSFLPLPQKLREKIETAILNVRRHLTFG